MRRARPLLAALALSAAACSGLDELGPPLSFTPDVLPDGTVGTPYAADVTVRDNLTPVCCVSVREGALPPGLRVSVALPNASTLTVSGTPTAAGAYAFTLEVGCFGTNRPGQTGSHRLSVTIR